MHGLIDLFLHLDVHLAEITTSYGPWIYAILFLIIFAETGLVVTPFLPGDSLLFACGALAARGILNPWLTFLLLLAAADHRQHRELLGRPLRRPPGVQRGRPRGCRHRLLNREHLARTHEFFEQYGGMAVVLGALRAHRADVRALRRGRGAMTYAHVRVLQRGRRVVWVGLCFGAGYAFGNVPIVKNNFSLVALGIVFVSLLPVFFEVLKKRRSHGDGAPPVTSL